MLEPKDRQLLLEALRPPIGFHFDEGIGTTYTLDLVALLTAPLAFTWFDQKDNAGADGAVDSLEIVESLRRYADRLTLFCHAGRIALLKAHYPQLAFLEDTIVECLPPSGGAFHPKVWVLRFKADEGEDIRYRMLCLSRNLTFSRAWDTMLALDGVLKKGVVAKSRGLADFVRALPDQAVRQDSRSRVQSRADLLASEVGRVDFELPENVQDFTFHPIGIGGRRKRPLAVLDGTKRLLVVSPFLAGTRLAELAEGRTDLVVVSTPSQLEGLSNAPRAGVRYFTLTERLRPEAEDDEGVPKAEAEAIELSDLHAKLYVTEHGAMAHVLTGSANATMAAFDKNVEFLVELVGHRKSLGFDAMMEPVKGETRFINLLQPADDIVGTSVPPDDVVALDRQLDDLRTTLAGAGLKIHVTAGAEGSFDLELRTEQAIAVPDGVKASCWPSAVATAGAPLRSTDAGGVVAQFPATTLQGVTAFMAFELSGRAGDVERKVDFVLTLPLIGAPEGRREQVLRSLVRDRSRMLRFLWLLLADEVADVPDAWTGNTGKTVSGETPGAVNFATGGLFEVLLKNLDRSPQRLDYLHGLMTELRKDTSETDLFPEEFDAIWAPIWAERCRQKGEVPA